MVISLILVLFSWWNYRLYIKKYERIVGLFKFIDIYWMERDKERYKMLLNVLNKDLDLLFRYKFKLDNKETFILEEK